MVRWPAGTLVVAGMAAAGIVNLAAGRKSFLTSNLRSDGRVRNDERFALSVRAVDWFLQLPPRGSTPDGSPTEFRQRHFERRWLR